MKIGMVGLGKMGANMVRRLRAGGHEVVGHSLEPGIMQQLAGECAMLPAATLSDLVAQLPAPRVVWLMVPAGTITQAILDELTGMLTAGDVVIDGGNSYYKDSQRRAEALKQQGIAFVDAGTSGGIWGLQEGYALMVGGEQESVAHVWPLLETLAPAPDRGLLHCGASGSGHFVKMIHNGIEYGIMQAYADGIALIKAKAEYDLDLAAIAEMWRHGSVIRSWLLDLTAEFLAHDQDLDHIEPFVPDSGEGRWTVLESVELGVPTPVMTMALMRRFASQGKDDFPNKLVAMMRNGFGGHDVKKGGKAE